LTCLPIAGWALALYLSWPGPIKWMRERQVLAEIKAQLDAATAADRFAGAARVAHEGHVVFDYASGMADRERRVANTIDTSFRIASMNKMFTAVSILQLVQAGKINLDAPIATYLPRYPNKDLASRVTEKHLLTHTAAPATFSSRSSSSTGSRCARIPTISSSSVRAAWPSRLAIALNIAITVMCCSVLSSRL